MEFGKMMALVVDDDWNFLEIFFAEISGTRRAKRLEA
jgi:hypothetical protein